MAASPLRFWGWPVLARNASTWARRLSERATIASNSSWDRVSTVAEVTALAVKSQ